MYYVYLLKCSDGSFYTGITTDLDRRTKEHNEGIKGAKYTRNRKPVSLVYFAPYSSRSDASKEEYRIKKLSRDEKIKLINN